MLNDSVTENSCKHTNNVKFDNSFESWYLIFMIPDEIKRIIRKKLKKMVKSDLPYFYLFRKEYMFFDEAEYSWERQKQAISFTTKKGVESYKRACRLRICYKCFFRFSNDMGECDHCKQQDIENEEKCFYSDIKYIEKYLNMF